VSRRQARELALQLLFQADVGKASIDDVLESAQAERPAEDWPFIVEISAGVSETRPELDAIIAAHLTGWTIDRMASIDRVILRMAVYEMRSMGTPASVVINEAVELAKKYGTEDSARFVNGILGVIHREALAGPPAEPSGDYESSASTS
jgi:N utilization substance protein B